MSFGRRSNCALCGYTARQANGTFFYNLAKQLAVVVFGLFGFLLLLRMTHLYPRFTRNSKGIFIISSCSKEGNKVGALSNQIEV